MSLDGLGVRRLAGDLRRQVRRQLLEPQPNEFASLDLAGHTHDIGLPGLDLHSRVAGAIRVHRVAALGRRQRVERRADENIGPVPDVAPGQVYHHCASFGGRPRPPNRGVGSSTGRGEPDLLLRIFPRRPRVAPLRAHVRPGQGDPVREVVVHRPRPHRQRHSLAGRCSARIADLHGVLTALVEAHVGK